MEAVAYGRDQSIIYNTMLVEGQSYDFLRVGFAPTEVGPLRYKFQIYSEYYVVLSQHSEVHVPVSTIRILVCSRNFTEFESVFQQRQNKFYPVR
jgi:hypothetical protein